MKFGKKWGSLRYEPWLSHYTDYKQLKKILKTSGPEGHFNFKFCLTNALKESNAFFVQTEQSFLKQYETEIKDIAVDETTTTAAHALATDVERLRDFAILNYLAVLKIVKKHDKKYTDNQLARTTVPTMLSMPFLRMKGLQAIISGLREDYGVKPLENMATRVDELLGLDGQEDSDEGDGEGNQKKDGQKNGMRDSQKDGTVAASKYHPDVVESQQSALAMQSKRMKTGFVSQVRGTNVSGEQKTTRGPQLQAASQEDLEAAFEISDIVIGKGSFGKVFLATDKRSQGVTSEGVTSEDAPENQKIAAKVIPTEKIAQVVAEIDSLTACQGCENVVALSGKGVYAMGSKFVAIMTELCDKELYDVVVSEAPLPQDEAHSIFMGVIGGIAHIHNCGYCHRDIKLENILIKDKVIKICDFGFAAPHSSPDGSVVMMNRQCGSLVYASPQSYHGKQYDGRTTDIWSAAVVLFVMVVGEFPFGRPDVQSCERFRLHVNGGNIFSEQCGVTLNHLMSQMLLVNATRRATMEEVRAHPWVVDGPKSNDDMDTRQQLKEQMLKTSQSRQSPNPSSSREEIEGEKVNSKKVQSPALESVDKGYEDHCMNKTKNGGQPGNSTGGGKNCCVM